MLDDGRLDPLAILTLCDTMPGAVGERMGRRDQLLRSRRAATSPCTCSATRTPNGSSR